MNQRIFLTYLTSLNVSPNTHMDKEVQRHHVIPYWGNKREFKRTLNPKYAIAFLFWYWSDGF